MSHLRPRSHRGWRRPRPVLPPYHPELNPIELAWAKLKALLKAIGARDIRALAVALKHAKDFLTSSDMQGWFRHCGYEVLAQCA